MEARNVCIIKPSALGDVVQALPVLGAVRTRFPQARVTWVVKRELADLVIGHPLLDHVVAVDFRGGFGSWRRLLADLRCRRFDLVFDLQGLARTALLTLATGAPIRVGLEIAREGAHWACNCTIPRTDRSVPAHARYRRVVEALGVDPDSASTSVPVTEEHVGWARRQLPSGKRPLLGIHAGAKWATKQWPAEKFAEVAMRAVNRYGAIVIALGGPDDRAIGDRLEAAIRASGDPDCICNLTGRTGLKQLAAVLAQLDLLLTNDSGPMHLAASLGTPVVGVFLCTSPRLSGPPGDRHELVATRISCAASYKKRCPARGSRKLACLVELDTDRVWDALERAIRKNGLACTAA